MFNDSTKFKLNDFITFSEIDEKGRKEVIFYHGENETYYSLNAMGSNIFNLIYEKNFSFGEIVENILNEYKASEETIRGDVESIIKDLLEEKIISIDEWIL